MDVSEEDEDCDIVGMSVGFMVLFGAEDCGRGID